MPKINPHLPNRVYMELEGGLGASCDTSTIADCLCITGYTYRFSTSAPLFVNYSGAVRPQRSMSAALTFGDTNSAMSPPIAQISLTRLADI